MANEMAGTAFYATWITASATVTLNTDFRNFTYTPSISFIDAAAGADTAPTRLAYMTDGDASCSFLMLNNMASADIVSFNEGTIGTLTWGEAGSAAGKTKVTLPAISQGLTRGAAYNDVVVMTASWLQNGTRTIGTF